MIITKKHDFLNYQFSMTKLLFILMLVFINTICFADEEHEQQRLDFIVKQILTKVNLGRSTTRLAHNELIKQQIKLQRHYEYNNLGKVMPDIFKKIYKAGVDATCKFDNITVHYINSSSDEQYAQIIIDPLYKIWVTPLDKQLSICDHYAYLAFSAVVFDIKNETGKNLFKSTVLMYALDNTGNHIATIVEGVSGNVYLVDPWAEKVIKIPEFTEKSEWKNKVRLSRQTIQNGFLLNENLSDEITKMYAESGYYDVAYIRPNTQWVLLIKLSEHISQLMQTYQSQRIRLLYRSMKPLFGWTDYANLFSGNNNEGLPSTMETKEGK